MAQLKYSIAILFSLLLTSFGVTDETFGQRPDDELRPRCDHEIVLVEVHQLRRGQRVFIIQEIDDWGHEWIEDHDYYFEHRVRRPRPAVSQYDRRNSSNRCAFDESRRGQTSKVYTEKIDNWLASLKTKIDKQKPTKIY